MEQEVSWARGAGAESLAPGVCLRVSRPWSGHCFVTIRFLRISPPSLWSVLTHLLSRIPQIRISVPSATPEDVRCVRTSVHIPAQSKQFVSNLYLLNEDWRVWTGHAVPRTCTAFA